MPISNVCNDEVDGLRPNMPPMPLASSSPTQTAASTGVVNVVESGDAIEAAGDRRAGVTHRIERSFEALQHDTTVAGRLRTVDAIEMGRHPDDVVALIHADGQDGATIRAGKRAIKEGAKDRGVVLIDGLTFIQHAEFCRRQAHRSEEIGANLARGVSCRSRAPPRPQPNPNSRRPS